MPRRIDCRNLWQVMKVTRVLGLKCDFGGTFTGRYSGHKILRKPSGVTFIFDEEATCSPEIRHQSATAPAS